MSELLYINGTQIDLPAKSVSMTFQVNDIADISDRNADYSGTIKIPLTQRNVKTLEFLGVTGNTTRLPYENVDVKYIVNDIEVISNGKGVLKSLSNSYSLVVYDGNISLTDLLGEQELLSLDFSAYNHTLTQDVFVNSFTNTDGYIYALGEFYDGSTFGNKIVIDLTSPSFYVHTLFSMIFTQKGYSVTGSIFSDADFKSRVTSTSKGYDRFTTENTTLKRTFNTGTLTDINEDFGTTVTYKEYTFDSYTATKSLLHTIELNGNFALINGVFGDSSGSGYFGAPIPVEVPVVAFYVNGNLVDFETIPVVSLGATVVLNISKDIQLNNGDLLELKIGALSSDDGSFQNISYNYGWTDTFYENDLSIDIDFNDIIGDTKQIDFVKDIMQHFGLLVRKIKNANTFEFIKIADVLSDKAGAEDWSDKYSGFLSESYKSNYAQTNFLRYEYDDIEGQAPQTFADGSFAIDDVNLELNKTVFTSIFKASDINNLGYVLLNHWVDDEGEIVINDDGLRFFKLLTVTTPFFLVFNEDVPVSSEYTASHPVLNFNTVYYGEEIDRSYLEFASMLNSYKVLNLEMDLDIIDIYFLDFFKLKRIDQLSDFFYLNKVSNYRPGRLTKVELVRIGADVLEANAMTGTTTGESVTTGTLTKSLSGEMTGITTGESVTTGTLTKTTVSLTAFSTNTTGESELNVCGTALDITRYHDGAGSVPVVSDIVYEDSGGLTPFDGGDLFYRSGVGYIEIDASGVVQSVNSCI